MMTKRLTKPILALLLALLMLVTTVAPVFAKMGSGNMPWLKEDSLLDQIMERDGFIDGIWFPWFNGGTPGHSLTGNEVLATYYSKPEQWSRVELDYIGADEIYRQIYNLKAMGYNMMAWGGSIYAEGVKLNVNTGEVLGIKEDYLANARRLLNMCREIGMPVVWNVYFHSSSMPGYYGMDGWHIVTRMCADNKEADHYAERFVRPLCKMLAEYKDVVAMVSIADEPENEINDSAIGDHFTGDRCMYGVNREDMLYLLRAINNVVKQELPGMPRTVASSNKNKSVYGDFALDLGGHNFYHNNAGIPEVETYKTSRPMILAEYNVGGDAKETDDELTNALITFRKRMMDYGYKGGLQWCWLPHGSSRGTSYYLLNSENNTDFRATVTDLRHYMEEYRAKFQGKTVTLDAPVLYANDGTGLVEWSPSKNAVKMDLLRSTDGGKSWVKVLDNVNPGDYLNNKKKGSYKDAKTANSIYKIVVRDAKGNSAESAPNHTSEAAEAYKQGMAKPQIPAQTSISVVQNTWKTGDPRLTYFGVDANRPVTESANLIKNGSFEANSGQWTSLVGSMASVVSDKTAPNGSKSLLFNSTGAKSGNWNTKFTVKVQKNTDYVFSVWVKGSYLSTSNLGHASIGVVNPKTGKFMVHQMLKSNGSPDNSANSYNTRSSREDQQIYPPAWDDEWHLRSVGFNSENMTEVTIALYGYGTKLWLDDMALFKNGDGLRYTSTNMASNLQVNYYSENYTCADKKCVNSNPGVDSGSYWNTGAGWDSGFLSVASGGKSGKAMKYSANNAGGEYYIKWVNVAPNTEYVFSVDAKILKSGDGRIGLLSDSLALPTEAVYLIFDQEVYGKDWAHFLVSFNTSGYTRVGISVCDLGGEALLDNIKLFKKADGTPAAGDTVGGQVNPDNAGNSSGNGGGNAQPDASTPEGDDPADPDASTDTPVDGEPTEDEGKDDNKKDKGTKKEFELNGPILLAISFGGTAVLIGLGVGIYFIIRAIVKKSKSKKNG